MVSKPYPEASRGRKRSTGTSIPKSSWSVRLTWRLVMRRSVACPGPISLDCTEPTEPLTALLVIEPAARRVRWRHEPLADLGEGGGEELEMLRGCVQRSD